MSASLAASPLDLLRRTCRRLIRTPYAAYAHRRLHRLTTPVLRGHRFETDLRVFHPICFLSTKLFIEHLLRIPPTGKLLLDMGTGSGAIGILAAAAGARVVACDLNPHAVELARRNAAANGVEIDLRTSDLFAAIGFDRFDLICFNIPFYPKPATTPLELALNAGENFETVRRFARDAHGRLAANGRVIIIFSEDSGYDRVIGIFSEAGWRVAEERKRRKNFELFHIVEFAESSEC